MWTAVIVLKIVTGSGIGDWYLGDARGPYPTREQCLVRLVEMQDTASDILRKRGIRIMARGGECRKIGTLS